MLFLKDERRYRQCELTFRTRIPDIHLLGRAVAWRWGFVNNFLKVTLACLGSRTAAVQMWNCQKKVYKTSPPSNSQASVKNNFNNKDKIYAVFFPKAITNWSLMCSKIMFLYSVDKCDHCKDTDPVRGWPWLRAGRSRRRAGPPWAAPTRRAATWAARWGTAWSAPAGAGTPPPPCTESPPKEE